jgi:hypothetical protein
MEEFRRFLLILSKGSLLSGTFLENMLARSEAKDLEVTDALYNDYRNLRASLLSKMREYNPGIDGALLLAKVRNY